MLFKSKMKIELLFLEGSNSRKVCPIPLKLCTEVGKQPLDQNVSAFFFKLIRSLKIVYLRSIVRHYLVQEKQKN